MRLGYHLKRYQDLMAALIMGGEMSVRESWSREQLLLFQEQRLQFLVHFARQRSPFYREAYSSFPDARPVRLAELPVITKKTVIENFDRFVTDPRLKLSDLYEYIERNKQDDYYLGNYVVLTTAGTSGLKGVFVYDRKSWRSIIAALTRAASFMGLSYGRNTKMATIGAGSPNHLSNRTAVSIDVGRRKVLRLDATAPFASIVAALDEFKPDYLKTYPSVAALLAEEQMGGRLDIRLKAVLTGAEVLTEDRKQKIQRAWGITPFDSYSATEGIMAAECAHHQGKHLFEDLCIVEVVDDENRPVPDGAPGQKILLTNLFNFTQPLIRYELTDMVTLSPEPCPCNRPFRLISVLTGRRDDVLYLEGPDGRPSPIHCVHFHSSLQELKEVREYQVIQRQDGLHVRVVVQEGASREAAAAAVREALLNMFAHAEVRAPAIHVHFVDWIERDPARMGKVKLVMSELTA